MPLGLDRWEIRAGFTYWVAEARQMDIYINDTAHNRTRLKIPGNSTIAQVCGALKDKWNLQVWDEVTLKRSDDAVIRYDPDKDSRPQCSIKIVTSIEHKVFLIEKYRPPAQDPIAIWTDICLQYGFVNPGMNLLQISGHPTDGLVTFTYKVSASLANVKIQAFTSRIFKIIVDEEEWLTSEVLSPRPWGREQIWEQLSAVRPLPHFSQFHFSQFPSSPTFLPISAVRPTPRTRCRSEYQPRSHECCSSGNME
jgi:hypothetical protein